MMKPMIAALAAVIAVAALPATAAPPDGKGADRARVYVAYKAGQRGPAQRALAAVGAEVHYDFPGLNGYAVSIPAVARDALARNPAVEYVEDDPKRYLMATETSPYGIAMVQADQVSDATASGVKVCIIDSGVDLEHEDFASSQYSGTRDSGTGDWFTDENGHGTHVAGTIAAVGGNGTGVVGVNPGGGLPIHIIKVFNADGWGYSSSLVAALNACEAAKDNNKLIVSMSLGGSFKSRFEDAAFADAYARGVLSIAAAGNDGNTRKSYPASYDSVVSVAAVDSARQVATFSQQNDQVELSGPGVAVRSTVPMRTGAEESLVVGGTGYEATGMDGSDVGTGTGALYRCGVVDGLGSPGDCQGASGKVCLIQRGSISFADKVLECQGAGGTAAVIYNNADALFSGTLGGVATTIPSVGVSGITGQVLLGQLDASTSVTVGAGHYAFFDGTSMATPHVAGVAALVWGQPDTATCTNAQIRAALNASALDLPVGANDGRDVAYGYGLVQAADALTTLGTNCGGSTGGGGGGGGGDKPGKGGGGGGGGKGKPK